uniref:uncharacterized protein LOC122593291 n=1 Tax=Erigeron canadensis TaxID=72917 RepID=UPI001CB98917|nr:uncharacterized protein LOC122593291 [Erigeron canadensis]
MDDNVDITIHDASRPRWEYMVESPIIEQTPSKYKLKLKYGGIFRLAKKSRTKRYCFGFQKSIYIDLYNWNLLVEEVMKHYPSNNDMILNVSFIDKFVVDQSFIELKSDENFMDEPHGEDDSDYCPSEESYHSHFSSDNENELLNEELEGYADIKKNPIMKVHSKFPNVVEFRRALNHHALINEFEYFIKKSEPRRFTARCAQLECRWRIHASIMQDDITFEVKTLVEEHSCIRSNKGGNKCATQGWIAEAVKDKLKSDGDVSPADLEKWLMKTYSVEIPYLKVYRGKEQAYTDMYGKWEDSFLKMEIFKEELISRNPGSVVEIDFEIDGDKKRFLRFFSLAACSKGFLVGCRPYISLDACHLKGKFNVVLAAATGIDGNNSIFPIAYGVLESENTKSWTWFLESLKKAIGTPNGLVISSDMQKGLEGAIIRVYPNVEHKECIRHLYRNFKTKFHGDFFNFNLWGASITYCLSEHDKLLKKIADVREDAITYLNENHKRIWSQSKFGTTSKCDYITNNVSEVFNSWIGANLGEYEVCRSSGNRAEVEYKGKRWDVVLDERTCSCRVWQVKGLPCVHAAAFIAFIRDSNWGKYVDPYFTIESFKKAYALEISPMPAKDQWIHMESGEKIYPPKIKRPAGRPKKNRILQYDERQKKQKCLRCGQYGHRQKRCKNMANQGRRKEKKNNKQLFNIGFKMKKFPNKKSYLFD